MPGVPHGRACNACRQQKKKVSLHRPMTGLPRHMAKSSCSQCNYATPSCSRCQRLGLECAGSGERRFLFIDQKCRRRRPGQPPADDTVTSLSVSRPAMASASFLTGAPSIPPTLPQTEVQMLTNTFVSTIAPSTRRVNLTQTYGSFLEMVPRRLGTNAALDSSARALVCAHQNVCLGRPATEESLACYALAIRTLRLYLGNLDSTAARSTETVCAIIMVIMCQVSLGRPSLNYILYSRGEWRIIEIRLWLCFLGSERHEP